MSRLAKICASRRGRVLLGVLGLSLAWQAWLSIQAPRKIPADLARWATRRGTVDLVVTLRFPPERFHILVFQRFGRVSGTSGNTAEVRGVKLDAVRGLARYYWVQRLEVAPDARARSPQG